VSISIYMPAWSTFRHHHVFDERTTLMGYMLNSLGNLPIDSDVKFYVFVINGQWQEPLYGMIEQNFSAIARSIGNHAVIAKGLNPPEWYGEIAQKYLGSDHNDYFSLLPALLLTDAHPSEVTRTSLRLLVPLRDVETRFGGWPRFFGLLSDFVQLKNDEFVKCFEKKQDAFDELNKVIDLKPGAFGIAININELVSWWRRRRSGDPAIAGPVVGSSK
jgi:hypothetical protein